MNRLVLNIGLLVNMELDRDQSTLTDNAVYRMFGYAENKTLEGSGDWGKEPTKVYCINLHNAHLEPVSNAVENLCIKLSQDAISYKLNGVGYIGFNPSYQGQKFEFKEEYFINF